MLLALGFQALAVAAMAVAPNGGWEATWSPDGKQIAFLSQRPGEPPNAWVMPAGGGAARQLSDRGVRSYSWLPDSRGLLARAWTGGRLMWCRLDTATGASAPAFPWLPATAQDPTISPDRARVAYVTRSGQWQDLWIAGANGAHPLKVTSRTYAQHLLWSPDGRRIAFEVANPHIGWQTQVWVYDPVKKTTAHMKRVGTALHGWAPNSKDIAFSVAMPPSSYLIGLCDVNTGAASPLKKAFHSGEGVSWSPDGKSLAVTVRRGSDSQVSVFRTSGTVAQTIGTAKLMARYPQISPDGRRILFEGQEKGSSFGSEVWVCDVSANRPRRLCASFGAEWAPCVSPDGKRVAFLSTRGHTCEVWVAGASGSSPKRLGAADQGARLVWSPGGGSLLVLQPRGSAVYPFSAAGAGEPLKINPAVPFAAWSPDGKRILYTGYEQHRPGLLAYEIGTHASRSFLHVDAQKTAADSFGVWSPNGARLAFIRGSDVWVANGGGAGARRLAPLGGRDELAFGDVRWSPRGDRVMVCFQRTTASGPVLEVVVVDMAGQVVRLINDPTRSEFGAQSAAYTSPPAWTANGDVIFTSDRAGSPQVWRISLKDRRPVASAPRRATYPAMLPDGRLLYVAPSGSSSAIWCLDPRTHRPALWSRAL